VSEGVLCVVCGIELVRGNGVCSVECARVKALCVRLKRLEDVLIEIKYVIKDSRY
jgi:predicted nucleic acid-binding Zn ribbon protein